MDDIDGEIAPWRTATERLRASKTMLVAMEAFDRA
jgi:hypothetical protein